MKKTILILSLLLSVQYVSGQNDSIKMGAPWEILNEYSVSMNYTIVSGQNTRNAAGFGLGLYHTFRPTKIINILLGIEFNRTSQFKKHIYNGQTSNLINISFNNNYLSFPVEVRFNIGKKVKWFIALGTYLELSVGGSEKGTLITYFNFNSTYVNKTEEYYANLGSYFNIGVSCGTGLKIPISKHELIIKPDFRWGIFNLIEDLVGHGFYNRYIRLIIGFRL